MCRQGPGLWVRLLQSTKLKSSKPLTGGKRNGTYTPRACYFWGVTDCVGSFLVFCLCRIRMARPVIGWYPGSKIEAFPPGLDSRKVTEIQREDRSRSGCTCGCRCRHGLGCGGVALGDQGWCRIGASTVLGRPCGRYLWCAVSCCCESIVGRSGGGFWEAWEYWHRIDWLW